MSRKKYIIAGAVILVAAGSIAAISATGPRHMGGRHGVGPDGHDGMGRRGMFQREITKDQYDSRVRERFARLDKNSDGVIEAGEIEAAFNERRGGMMQRMRGGRDGAQGGPMFGRFDANKDGKVTKDEALAKARKRFAERDLNSDGKISDEDLPPMMRGQNAIQRMVAGEHGGRRGGRGGPMGGGFGGLTGAEVKDGAITLDAALAAAGRQFDRFDYNKDGVLDQADRDAMRKDMTDYGVKRFIHANGASKDGKVTREQFFAKANERFAEMDVNGDSKLGRGEFGGGRGMMGGREGGRHHGMHGGMDHEPKGGPMGGGRRGPAGGPGDAPPKQ